MCGFDWASQLKILKVQYGNHTLKEYSLPEAKEREKSILKLVSFETHLSRLQKEGK